MGSATDYLDFGSYDHPCDADRRGAHLLAYVSDGLYRCEACGRAFQWRCEREAWRLRPAAGTPQMLADVLHGLRSTPRSIPSQYFYDAAGSRLFDRITTLEAYYPTRTEYGILEAHLEEIAALIGPDTVLLEYGSGSSTKTRLLLDRMAPASGSPGLLSYVPIDISEDHLLETAAALRAAYPGLRVEPVAADYTRPLQLPDDPEQRRKRVVFFPGSTIGNFEPADVGRFLRDLVTVVGPGGGLLLGVDRPKDRAILEAAYDDPEGVTAAFNLNLLVRLNRELDADFCVDAWQHRACFNAGASRVEMHLVSGRPQTVHIGCWAFAFAGGETIHTENSYKYAPGDMASLAAAAGLQHVRTWSDARGWFAVQYYTVGVEAG